MYRSLTLFLLPLALVVLIRDLSSQILNGGMARLPDATATLASFGLAFGLFFLVAAPLSQLKQTGLVLVNGRHSFRSVNRYVWICSLIITALMASFTRSPLGDFVIETAHDIAPPFSLLVRQAVWWLTGTPLILGLTSFYSGLLLRVRRTDIAGYSTIAGIITSTLSVFGLLPLPFIQETPLLLPVLATYVRMLTELLIVGYGYWRFVQPVLRADDRPLGAGEITRFFWPLAFILLVQGASRPIINLFVARGPDGEMALAVLTVVYALGLLPYGWLNELKNVPAAFMEEKGMDRPVRTFAVICGAISFGSMILLFWTPLRDFILLNWIGVDSELAALSRVPLIIFSLFPLAVAPRSHLHGIGMAERRTGAMALSAPARFFTHLIVMILLIPVAWPGANEAMVALFFGFVVEAVAVWWGLNREEVGKWASG